MFSLPIQEAFKRVVFVKLTKLILVHFEIILLDFTLHHIIYRDFSKINDGQIDKPNRSWSGECDKLVNFTP